MTVTLRLGEGSGSGYKVLDQMGFRLRSGRVQIKLQVISFTPLFEYRLGSDHCRLRSDPWVGSDFDSFRVSILFAIGPETSKFPQKPWIIVFNFVIF